MDPVTTKDGQNEADLVERIRSGDQQAEAELFNRYRRGVRVILLSQGLSPDLADDLLQETITITLEKIKTGKVEKPDRLSALICAVARNLAIGFFRRESRMFSVEEVGARLCSPLDQHQQLLREEEAQMVRRVIAELRTDRDRTILLRYYLGEEDKEKICADLGLSSPHFSRVLHRALQRFKELFEKQREQVRVKPVNTREGSK